VREIALDHVGVVTRDLTALATQYERLGFTLAPLARHADGRIGNRCVMLRDSYIELLAVVDPAATSATLERFLARHPGVHILAFSVTDPQAEVARLRRAGVAAPAVTHFERSISDGSSEMARFDLMQLPDQPEGRFNLVHHQTRDLLWQDRFLHHRNNALGLEAVELTVTEPLATAARLSRLLGCPAVPDPREGISLELTRGRLRLIEGDGPRVTRLTISMSDVSRSAMEIDGSEAGGVALQFTKSGWPGLSVLPPQV
jgi:hypothetical protein